MQLSKLRADAPAFMPKYLTYNTPIYRIGMYKDIDNYQYFDYYSIHPFEHVSHVLDTVVIIASSIDGLFDNKIDAYSRYDRSNVREFDMFAIDCFCHIIGNKKSRRSKQPLFRFERKIGDRFEPLSVYDVHRILTESIE